MDENKRSVCAGLIENSAFMRVTLEDLQEQISGGNLVDQYRNGENQFGLKQSANLQAYNALMKNYTVVMKQLLNMLPGRGSITSAQRLNDFIAGIDNE